MPLMFPTELSDGEGHYCHFKTTVQHTYPADLRRAVAAIQPLPGLVTQVTQHIAEPRALAKKKAGIAAGRSV